MNSYAQLAEQYRTALLDDCMPFWLDHSLDREQGGYFTCLDRDVSTSRPLVRAVTHCRASRSRSLPARRAREADSPYARDGP